MFYGCSWLKSHALHINGRIDTGEKRLALCCEGLHGIPASTLCNTPEGTIKEHMKMYAEAVEECKAYGNQPAEGKRIHTNGCAKCPYYTLGDWENDGRIHYVNFSMYPAPCQCKCFYCGVRERGDLVFNKQDCAQYYDVLIASIEYAMDEKLIAPDATWQISTGEITIHPYKERILELVKNKPSFFYTNCFKFDEDIAANLSSNPSSAINLSIDSGTPETWYKIKGVDNFDTVTDNLVKYYKSSARPGQITLKYIVFPGINDNLEDYLSVIEIMKILRVDYLSLSRDVREKYTVSSEDREELAGATGYLLALLHKNGLSFNMATYAPIEREMSIAFANKLLKSGEV